jgi:hypothetical protein
MDCQLVPRQLARSEGLETPTFKSIGTREAVRDRSEQSMTLDASVSNVHVRPKPRQVACPIGSHVGSRP